jgi:hypothetical protein
MFQKVAANEDVILTTKALWHRLNLEVLGPTNFKAMVGLKRVLLEE